MLKEEGISQRLSSALRARRGTIVRAIIAARTRDRTARIMPVVVSPRRIALSEARAKNSARPRRVTAKQNSRTPRLSHRVSMILRLTTANENLSEREGTTSVVPFRSGGGEGA